VPFEATMEPCGRAGPKDANRHAGARFAALTITLLLGACTVATSQVETRDQDLRLSLFHTTDWHSRILPYTIVEIGRNDINLGLRPENNPVGGAARLATMLKCARVKDLSKIPAVCCCLEPSKCQTANDDSGQTWTALDTAGPKFNPPTEPICCTRRDVDNTCSTCKEDQNCAADPGNTYEALVGSERLAYMDSGDYFQGAPIFNAFGGEPEMRIMSYLKADAVVIGNHEFDKGLENLADLYLRWGTYPLLAANYLWDSSKFRGARVLKERSQAYTILNMNGVKVGVIGMANFSSMLGIFRGDNDTGLTPLNPFQVLQDYIDFLKPQVDIVIALSHMGLRGDDNFNPEDEELVANTSGLDLILGGHLHIVLKPPKVLFDCVTPRCSKFGQVPSRRVFIEHSGSFLKYATRLDVVVRNKEIVSYQQYVYPIDRRIPEDGIVNEMLEPYVFETSRRFDLTRVHAFTSDQRQRFDIGGGDSDLGNLVCESMQKRRRVETDFCMTNSLGIRDIFPPGKVTDEQLFNVLPFENLISTLFLSGKEVQELYDYVTFRSSERGCNSQAQVSGSSFVMNCAKIRAERITIGGSRAGCFADAHCKDARAETGAPGGEICTFATKNCPDVLRERGIRGCERANAAGTACDAFCCPANERGEHDNVCQSCFRPIDLNASYSLATNDYIARGGSGFLVLERNTTQVNTGIALRQAVIDFLAQQKPCCKNEDDDDPLCLRARSAGYANKPCIYASDFRTPWGAHDGRITRITAD
jgi:5'-nucleotidase